MSHPILVVYSIKVKRTIVMLVSKDTATEFHVSPHQLGLRPSVHKGNVCAHLRYSNVGPQNRFPCRFIGPAVASGP